MVVSSVVVLVGALVVLVSGSTELRDTMRSRRAAPDSGHPAVAGVGRWPPLAWFGLAAITVLPAAAIVGAEPEIFDLAFLVIVIGFAGDRAFYLVRRRTEGAGRALSAEILAVVIGAVGLLAGFTI